MDFGKDLKKGLGEINKETKAANKNISDLNSEVQELKQGLISTQQILQGMAGKDTTVFNVRLVVDTQEARDQLENLNLEVEHKLSDLNKFYEKDIQNAAAKTIQKWNEILKNNPGLKLEDLVNVNNKDIRNLYHRILGFQAQGGDLSSLGPELGGVVIDSLNEAFSQVPNSLKLDDFKTAFSGIGEMVRNGIVEAMDMQDIQIPKIEPLDADFVKAYQDALNDVTNETSDLDEAQRQAHEKAMQRIKEEQEARRKAAEEAKRQAEEQQKKEQELAQQRKKNAQEQFNEFRGRVTGEHHKHKYDSDEEYEGTIDYDSNTYKHSMKKSLTGGIISDIHYSYEGWNDEVSEAAEEYNKIFEKLTMIEKINKAIQEVTSDIESQEEVLKSAEESFILTQSKGDEKTAQSFLKFYENEYETLMEYKGQLDYLNQRLQEETQNTIFGGTVGDSWDAKNIERVIVAIQELVKEMGKLSKAFDTAEKESPFSRLLEQVGSLSTQLPKALNNTSVFDGFKSQLESLAEEIGKISNMTVNGPSINFDLSGDDFSDQWAKAYKQYRARYEKIAEWFEKNSTLGNRSEMFREYQEYLGSDAEKIYGVSKIEKAASQGTASGYKGAIQIIMNYINALDMAIKKRDEFDKAVEAAGNGMYTQSKAMRELPKIFKSGELTGTDMGRLENVIAERAANDTTSAAGKAREEQKKAVKALFGDNTALVELLEKKLIPAIQEIKGLLAQGFKIENREEVQTFFQKLAENVKTLETGMSSITQTVGALNTALSATDDNPNPLGLSPDQLQPLQQALDKVKQSLSDISQLMADSKLSSERLANMADAESKPEKKKRARNVVKKAEGKSPEKIAPKTTLEDAVVEEAGKKIADQRETLKKNAEYAMKGGVAGIHEAGQEQIDECGKVAQGSGDIVAEIWEENSPSKLFKRMARFCIEGAIIGFTEGKDDLLNTVKDVFSLNGYITSLGSDKNAQSEFVNQFTSSIISQFNLKDADAADVSGAIQGYVNNVVNGVNLDDSLKQLGKSFKTDVADNLRNQMEGIDTQKADKYIQVADKLSQYLNKNANILNNSDNQQAKDNIISNIDLVISKLKEYQTILKDTASNTNLQAQLNSNLEYLSGVKSNLEQYGTLNVPAGSQPRAIKDQEVKVSVNEQSLLDAKGRMQDVLGEIEVQVKPSGQLQESTQVATSVVKNGFDDTFAIIYNQIALLKNTLSDPALSGLTIKMNSNIGEQIQIIEDAVANISKKLGTSAGEAVGDAVVQRTDDLAVTPDEKKPEETGVPIKIITDRKNLLDAKAKIEEAFSNILVTIGGLTPEGEQNLEAIVERIKNIQQRVTGSITSLINDFNAQSKNQRNIEITTNAFTLIEGIKTKLQDIKIFTSTINFDVDNKSLTTAVENVKAASIKAGDAVETVYDKFNSLYELFKQTGDRNTFIAELAKLSNKEINQIVEKQSLTGIPDDHTARPKRATKILDAMQARDATLQIPDKATEQYSTIITKINEVRESIKSLVDLLSTAPEKSVLSAEITALQGLLKNDIPAVERLLSEQSSKIDASVDASISKLGTLVEKINSVSGEVQTKIDKTIGVNVEVYGPSKENIKTVQGQIETLKQLLNNETPEAKENKENQEKYDINNKSILYLDKIREKVFQLEDALEKLKNVLSDAENTTEPISKLLLGPNGEDYLTNILNLINSFTDNEIKTLKISKEQMESYKQYVIETIADIRQQSEKVDTLGQKAQQTKNKDTKSHRETWNIVAKDTTNELVDNIYDKVNGYDDYLSNQIRLRKKLKEELSKTIETPKTESSNLTKQFEDLAGKLSHVTEVLSSLKEELNKPLDLTKLTSGFSGLKGETSGISDNISNIISELGKEIPQIDLSEIVRQYTNLNTVANGIDTVIGKINIAIEALGRNQVLSQKIGEVQSYLQTELDGLNQLVETIKSYGTIDLKVVNANSEDLHTYVGYLTEIVKVLEQLPFDMEQVNAAFEVLQDVIRGVLKTASESVLGIAGATATLVQDINKHDIAIGVDSKPIVDEITRIQGLAQQILSHFTSTIEVKSNIDTEVDYINNKLKPLTDSTIEVELEVKSDIDTELERINNRAADVANLQSFIKVDSDADEVIGEIKKKAEEIKSMQVGLTPIDTKTVETIVNQIGQVNSALEQLIPSPTFITAGEQIDKLRQKFMDLVDVFRSNKDKDAFVTALQGFKKTELEQIAKYDGIKVNASHSKGNTKDVIAGNIGDKVEEGLKRKSLADEPMQAAVKYEELFQKVKAVAEQVETLRTNLDTLFNNKTISEEYKLFDKLIETLKVTIPQAIAIKNAEFRNEQQVVSDVVSGEVAELGRLKKAIEDVIKAIDFKTVNLGELSRITDIFDALNKLVGSTSLKDFYETMKNLAETVSDFNLDVSNNNVFSKIEGMLSKKDELENLVRILAESEEKIKTAEAHANKQTRQKNNANNGGGNNDSEEFRGRQVWSSDGDKVLADILSKVDGSNGDDIESIKADIGQIIKILTHTDKEGNIDSATIIGQTGTISGRRHEDKEEGISYFEFGGVSRVAFSEEHQLKVKQAEDAMLSYDEKLRSAGLMTKELEDEIDKLWDQLIKMQVDTSDNAPFNTFNLLTKDFKPKYDAAFKDADKTAKDSTDAIEKLTKARSNYNKVLAKNITDPLTTTADDVKRASEEVIKAYAEAEKAMQRLIDAKNNNKAGKEQYLAGLRAFNSDDALYGSQESRRDLRNARQGQVIKDLKKASDARSKLNDLEAKSIEKGSRGSFENRNTDAMKAYSDAIDDAKKSLAELIRTQDNIDPAVFNQIFNMLYKARSDTPEGVQQLASTLQLFDDLVKMGDQVDDKAVDSFFYQLQQLSSGEVFTGSSQSIDGIGEAIKAQFEKAEKAVDKYEKALEKVKKYQDALAIGENVAGRLLGANNQLRDAKKDADREFKELMAITNNGDSTRFEEIKKRMDSGSSLYDSLQSLDSNGKDAGFQDAVTGYQTLAKGALNYYKIQTKIANQELLSPNEMRFLQKVSDYYKEATASATDFEKHLGLSNNSDEYLAQLEKARGLFSDEMVDSRKSVVQSFSQSINNQLSQLGSQSGLPQFREAVIEVQKQFDKLVAENSHINWELISDEQFQETIRKLGVIQQQMKELSSSEDYQPVNEVERQNVIRKASEWQAHNAAAKEANQLIETYKEELRTIDDQGSLNRLKGQIEEAKASAYDSGKFGTTFFEKLKVSISNLSRYLMSFASFYRLIDAFRRGIEVVKDLDKQFTEMRKVSDESADSIKRYQQRSFELANTVGTTASQIQQSTADFMRLGESLEEASESARMATMLLNVSEFTSIDAATDSLVAMSQAFQELDKLEIIDKLNNIGLKIA